MKHKSINILAKVLGLSEKVLSENRYEPFLTKLPIYVINGFYFCCSSVQPNEIGLDFRPHDEQGFAGLFGKTIWRAKR